MPEAIPATAQRNHIPRADFNDTLVLLLSYLLKPSNAVLINPVERRNRNGATITEISRCIVTPNQ